MRALLVAMTATVAIGVAGCGDAGDDWDSVSGLPAGPQTFGIIDLWAFAPDDVWFLDGSATVYRWDGDGFTTLETPSTGGLGCIFALSASDAYLCAGSAILHWDGVSFTSLEVASATGVDNLVGIYAASPAEIVAIGDSALVAHGDGQSWTTSNSGATFASSIWGTSASNVYVLGTFDLVQWDGQSWSQVTLDSGGGDGQVWGTGPSDVWVMTDSSQLSHFDGVAWETVDTFDDFVGDLAAVWGPTPDDLWAAGSAGSIAHFDGESWTELAHQPIGAPYLRVFVAVHGTSSTDVWAVGHQLGEGGSTPVIYHYAP